MKLSDRLVGKEISFIDHPDNITLTVFLAGCNMNCKCCFNKSIIDIPDNNLIPVSEVYKTLTTRSDFIDSVTISGGEPLIDIDSVKELINGVNYNSYMKINLFTNGTKLNNLKEVIPLVDRVAMDIKKPLEYYDEPYKVSESISLIIDSNIDYEFRTVVTSDITTEDIDSITRYMDQNYVLRPFIEDGRPVGYTDSFIDEIRRICKNNLENYKIEL